jgi:hypothetical protein
VFGVFTVGTVPDDTDTGFVFGGDWDAGGFIPSTGLEEIQDIIWPEYWNAANIPMMMIAPTTIPLKL